MAEGAAGSNARSWAAMKAQPEHVVRGMYVSEANQKSVGAEEQADN